MCLVVVVGSVKRRQKKDATALKKNFYLLEFFMICFYNFRAVNIFMLCRFLYFEFEVQMQSSVAAHVCCQVWPYGVPAVTDSLTGDHSIRLFVLKKGLVGHHQVG